jgi:hypothetical protein
MGGVEVVGQSGVVLNRGDPKGGDAFSPGEDPQAVVAVGSPVPSVGEEGLYAKLDMTVGADGSILDLKVAGIMLEAVLATREVHQLWEILPTTSRVSGYFEKSITQKQSSHACLIIKILA